MAISADKKKKLAGVMAGINKKFGGATVNFVSDIQDELAIKYYPTPSHEFNTMLGGGMARGKIVELYGENSSGKTSMAIETIAHNQKLDPNFTAGWFETEGSIDPEQLEAFGVDMDRLVYWDQKDVGAEQGFDILRSLVSSGEFDMIICNSVAGLCPTKEVEDEMDKANIALTARMLSKLFRVITGAADKHGTSLVFINQIRANVGVLFGNPETTTGGKALAFYASQRVGMRRVKLEKADPITEDEGLKVRCRTQKNRYAKGNPYKVCDYIAIYGVGIDSVSELPDILEREGILSKSGSWYYWKDDNGDNKVFDGQECKWRSRSVLVEELRDNDALRTELEEAIKKLQTSGKAGVSVSAEEIQEIEQSNKELENLMEATEEI